VSAKAKGGRRGALRPYGLRTSNILVCSFISGYIVTKSNEHKKNIGNLHGRKEEIRAGN
jgi:hypothetical protein